MIQVGVLGATGYAGAELVRLLLGHPQVELAAVGSVSHTGGQLAEQYPSLQGLVSLPLADTQQVLEQSQLIFASLPHGFSQEIAQQALAAGKKVIDLGADFRLEQEEVYQEWYGGTFLDAALQEQAPYGLPELFRKQIPGSAIVANPGCYPTCAALGLAPLVEEGVVRSPIIIDAKSGVTGAGRTPTATTHFPQCSQTVSPYSVGAHRHRPEIEQTLEKLSGQSQPVIFTPHLVPVNRGILSTMYCDAQGKMTLAQLHERYTEYYKQEYFVRVLPLGKTVTMGQVAHSNYCDISLHQDKGTGQFIIAAVLDNMVKGAAGQAIQNMNLLYGLPEETGLTMVPAAF